MRFPLGRKATLYQSVDGTAYNPNGKVKDVGLNLTTKEDDDTIRDSGDWDTTAVVSKVGAVEFNMLSDSTDARFLELQASFFNNTPLRIKAMSGLATIATSKGLEAWMTVTNLSRTENLGEVQKYQVSLKNVNPPVGKEGETPAWITGVAP